MSRVESSRRLHVEVVGLTREPSLVELRALLDAIRSWGEVNVVGHAAAMMVLALAPWRARGGGQHSCYQPVRSLRPRSKGRRRVRYGPDTWLDRCWREMLQLSPVEAESAQRNLQMLASLRRGWSARAELAGYFEAYLGLAWLHATVEHDPQ